jgi:hypothetical protein
MEKLIEQIQSQFMAKIINGDYTVKSFQENYLMIEVDEKYPFSLWLGSDASMVHIWSAIGGNFMPLPDFTPEEKKLIFEYTKQLREDNKDEIRMAKIIALKSELEKLESI